MVLCWWLVRLEVNYNIVLSWGRMTICKSLLVWMALHAVSIQMSSVTQIWLNISDWQDIMGACLGVVLGSLAVSFRKYIPFL